MVKSITDYRRMFYGKDIAEYDYLKDANARGITARDVLDVVESGKPLPGLFGDGSSGDKVVAGTETLLTNSWYNNLTVPVATILRPDGWLIIVRNTLTIAGTIEVVPNNGLGGGTAGIATSINSIGGGSAGGAGTAAAGTAAAATSNTLAFGGNGGAGGAGASGAGGAGSVTNVTATVPPRALAKFFNSIYHGGRGGGGGGGDTLTSGAGGGSGGGVIMILCRELVLQAGHVFAVPGGNGGAGQGANTGGGGGGGGGLIVLHYQSKSGVALNTNRAGGNGGGGTGTGVAGTAGAIGTLIDLAVA